MNILSKKLSWQIDKKRVGQASAFWNMMSAGLTSIVSMILLWYVTRVNGIYDAGIFSLWFSTAQMLLTIGNYGMRNFQATDLTNKYSMGTYLASRIVTCCIMMMSALAFVIFKGYFFEKAVIILLLNGLKVTDAMDDVYGAFYQKQGRLDVSGKIMSFRIISYLLIFCIGLFWTHDLLFACSITVIGASIVLVVLIISTKKYFCLSKPSFEMERIKSLLVECLPLCVSSFLLIYLGNAPKYAIDSYLTEEMQAYYTYLFMPCFVINLFVSFVIQPLLVRLSKYWIGRKYDMFVKMIIVVFLCTIGVAVIILAGGWLIGSELLSIVFGVKLTQYKNILIILLVGGAFFAFSTIEQVVLTVMRKQVYLLVGFGISSLTAFVISDSWVKKVGLLGAGYSYMVSTGVLFLSLTVMFIIFFSIEKCKENINASIKK